MEFRLYLMGSRGSWECFHLGLAWPNQSLIHSMREGPKRPKLNGEISHRLKERFRRVKKRTPKMDREVRWHERWHRNEMMGPDGWWYQTLNLCHYVCPHSVSKEEASEWHHWDLAAHFPGEKSSGATDKRKSQGSLFRLVCSRYTLGIIVLTFTLTLTPLPTAIISNWEIQWEEENNILSPDFISGQCFLIKKMSE